MFHLFLTQTRATLSNKSSYTEKMALDTGCTTLRPTNDEPPPPPGICMITAPLPA